MGSIFGIIDKKAESIDEKILNEPMKVLASWDPDVSNTWHYGNMAFGHNLLITTQRSKMEVLPFFDIESGCCIIADCRIDYREELAKELGIIEDVLSSIPDSILILRAYLKWGQACLDHLFGDFVFAIWDEEGKELFCARDQIGCRPLYYYDDERYFIFSSNLKGILCVPGIKIEFDEDTMPWIITSSILPENQTIYHGIVKLPPASFLKYGMNKEVTLYRYWEPEVDPDIEKHSEDVIVKTFIRLYKDSVVQRIRGLSIIGMELSGGLDSSSIAAVLQKVKNGSQNVSAFVHSFSETQKQEFYPFNDEYDVSKLVAEFVGIQDQYFVNGEKRGGVLKAIEGYIDKTSLPVIQLFSEMSDLLLEDASNVHCKVMLSGFGGDEFVTYNAQSIIDEYFSQGEWKLLWSFLNHRHNHWFFRYLVFLIRLHRYWVLGLIKSFGIVRKKKIARYRISDLAIRKSEFRKYKEQISQLHRKQLNLDFKIRNQQLNRVRNKHVAFRLENSYHMALDKKMEYAYPLLDLKLINFVYSLPAEYMNRFGEGRYLIRKAMESLLPDEIRLRNNKFGAAMPNVHYRIHKDKELIKELIEEGRANNQFHYFDYDKLLMQLDLLSNRKIDDNLTFGPLIFTSVISFLIMQKWTREGKIDVGIKC